MAPRVISKGGAHWLAALRVSESEKDVTRRLPTIGVLAMVIAVSPWQREAFGQEQAKGAKAAAAATSEAGRNYVPPRTPWGDPDLQGIYTNKYEHQTPFERPAEFEGRRVQDVSGAELDAL